MRIITRSNQKPDVIYRVLGEIYEGHFLDIGDDCLYFVTPDGEGRYYYEMLAEAQAQHGDLPVRSCWTEEG